MKPDIFEILERAQFIRKGEVQEGSVVAMPFSDLLGLIDEVAVRTAEPSKHLKRSLHTHCASLGLGGARDECWHPECRMEAINELTRFAALYSDQVIVHNFLSDHAPSWGHPPEEDSELFRQEVLADLTILLKIRPLIESGHIVLFTPEEKNVCPYCYSRMLFGSGSDERFQVAFYSLAEYLLHQMEVDFRRIGDGAEYKYEASYTSPKDLFRHEGRLQPFRELPEAIASKSQLVEKLNDGKVVALPSEVKLDLGLHFEQALSVQASLRYQMAVAEATGASFLVNRDVDLDFLTFISNDADIERRNAIVSKYLNAIVPFGGDVPVSQLLKLREREEEAFVKFRAALDNALEELVTQKESFSERDARELYADIIEPEVARLNQRVKEAKRDLVKVPLASTVGTVAIIGFGLYSGMVPAELSEVASLLGLSKILYDTTSKGVELLDVERSIRPERFYFLWKTKRLA